jgi:hypothetical protein
MTREGHERSRGPVPRNRLPNVAIYSTERFLLLNIVPLGIAVAWMEAGRFLVLYRHRPIGLALAAG